MPLIISDDILRDLGLGESEALCEIACQLFRAGRLTLWKAAQLAGLDRVSFEDELRQRAISIHQPTLADLEDDMQALDRLGI
jgi:predicted HTH domain antitoxin